jgi:ATP-dependent Clp protease protease subunit
MSILNKTKEPRNLYLYEGVGDESVSKLIEKIQEFNHTDELIEKEVSDLGFTYERKPINLYIDTNGGAVMPTFGLINLMERSKTPVHTYSMGRAMSAGFLILIHGKKRFASKNTTIMLHQISTVEFGNLKKIENEMELTKRLQSEIEDMIIRKTNIDSKTLKNVYDVQKDWYMTSDEALKLNVVDEVI